jgi:pimeloyl-ACP methyl ester carboxylesterase
MNPWLEKQAFSMADHLMCSLMNRLQWKLRHLACTEEELDHYLTSCEAMTREEFFSIPGPPKEMNIERGKILSWPTPQPSGYPENDVARAEVFWGPNGKDAPTVFLLHALMSAHSGGYRMLALKFNKLGWNAVFPHLPYHYSRVPRGHRNGFLAVTANHIRNSEGMRQAVREVRQLKAWFASMGVREFGLIGTSYGGWAGALTSFLEDSWRFLGLVQPIANVDRAIWDNPAAASIRRILMEQGIGRNAAWRHRHLTSPMEGSPCLRSDHIVLCSGIYDKVSPPFDLEQLRQRWGGVHIVEVHQGHFGFRSFPATLAALEPMLRVASA